MSRAFAFALWALAAASAVFWGLKLFVTPVAAPPYASVAATSASPRGDLSRLFGAEVVPVAAAVEEAPAPEDNRFELIGVVAPRPGTAPGEGVALIAVDGKAPRAYRVGAVIDGNTVLQGVHPRGASLGVRGGATQVSLELPPPAPAATGVPQPAPGAAFVPPPQPAPGAAFVPPPQPAPGAAFVPPRLPTPAPAARPMPPRLAVPVPRPTMQLPAEVPGEPDTVRSDALQRE